MFCDLAYSRADQNISEVQMHQINELVRNLLKENAELRRKLEMKQAHSNVSIIWYVVWPFSPRSSEINDDTKNLSSSIDFAGRRTTQMDLASRLRVMEAKLTEEQKSAVDKKNIS